MAVTEQMMRLAKFVYRRTPVLAIRVFFYRTFAWIVRHRKIERSIDGAVFALDLGETIELGLFLGEFEKDVQEVIRKACRPGMTVLDIGANIGANTMRLARAVSPGGRVIAFEPTQYAFERLSRNVSLNPGLNVTPVFTALADSEQPPRSVNFRASWPTFGPRRDGETIVGFQTVDDWCERNGVERVDFVKMDVDGNEYGVLRGAERMLSRSHPTFIMEVVGPHLDDEERNPLRLLERHGYSFRDAKSGAALTMADMRRVLPVGDTELSTSINIVAESARRG